MLRLLAPTLIGGIALLASSPLPCFAQAAGAAEIELLRQEMRRLQERLQKIEQARAPAPTAPVVVPVAAQAPPVVAPRPGERELQLEREHPLETLGLPIPEVAGLRIPGLFVGSANYHSHIQIVPEFAGGAPASSEPHRTDFRFDQFTIGAFK